MLINSDPINADQYEHMHTAANEITSLPTCRCKPRPGDVEVCMQTCPFNMHCYILCIVKCKTRPSKFIVSLFLCHVVQQLGSQLVNFDQNQSCLSLLRVYDGFALGPHE